MNQKNHILICKMTNFTSILLRLTVEQKKGASRPYFSNDERLDFMKELGFRMYSDNNLKCSCCDKSDLELAKLKKKLVLCASCKGAWYRIVEETAKRRIGRRVTASFMERLQVRRRSRCDIYRVVRSDLVICVRIATSMIHSSLFSYKTNLLIKSLMRWLIKNTTWKNMK